MQMDLDSIPKTAGLAGYLRLATPGKKLEILQLVRSFCDQIRVAADPFALASRYIDGLLSAAIEQVPGFDISCTKGCWYCCQPNVLISEVEAKKIVSYLNDNQHITLMDHDDSRCLFLNGDDACSIYPVRPLICRKTLVASDPELCSPQNGNDNAVQLKTDVRVEALVTAFWHLFKTAEIREFFGQRHRL